MVSEQSILLVSAFAKINLALEVVGKHDSKYHTIKTILQTIGIRDIIEIRHWNRLKVECDVPGISEDNNLVWHAAQKLADRAGIQPKAEIIINKQIPIGMGLGGGSSDAATVLVALNDFWELHLEPIDLSEIAKELGSDVPFFLQGGTALGENHGELITQLPDLPPLELLLIFPNQTIPNKTSTLYSQLMSSNFSDGGITNKMVSSLLAGQLPIDAIFNVFESIAFQTFPALSDIFQVIEENIVSRPHLCGSGPAIFCLPSNRTEFDQLSSCLRNTDFVVYFTNCIESKAVQCQSINSKNNRS